MKTLKFTPIIVLFFFINNTYSQCTADFTFSNANGCENYAEEWIWVDACTGISTNPLSNGISIYPNPNNGSFNIELNLKKDNEFNIQLINVLGEPVFEKSDIPITKGYIESVNLKDHPDGLYYVLITGKNTSITRKVIIK